EKYKDSFIYAEKLFLRKKVAVVPGINFSKNAKSFIRINLSLPLKEFKEGIERIEEFEKEN
ncbi:MAG: pyridoxal phosphate-dependent aminotransferase, partial [Thermoanaerobaculia bacterium]